MFEKIEGGTIINIQGLDCSIPPEGYVYNIVTKELDYVGVYERSSIKEEQYWERIEPPSWYKSVMKKWDDYEKKRKDEDEDFYDERLEEYKKQEWHRRLNGFWFRNNGECVYLTGMHYMYLQWWPIDVGYAKYRLPDLEYFYFLQYCIEDPKCLGALEVTKRRFGKSYRAGLFVSEYVTRTKMTNGGIQSKTGMDAKKFFAKTVVNPFRRLPRFFRPEYDMSLGVNPKTEMRFQKTNVRGKKAEDGVGKDELGSIIDWQSSDKVAYDGQKLHRYVADETGKSVEVDVYDRHEVVRYCLLDDEGKIIGKALYTTTVEKIESDKDGVQDAFKLLWKESDQYNRHENGMTASGLYRFFMSAQRARNFDKYGFPDEEKTLKEILADRASVKNNPRALNARIRKEPLTIEEAFSEDGDKCVFNINNIQDREKYLNENPIYKREVLFDMDGQTQKVFWRDARPNEKDFCWQFTGGLTDRPNNEFTFIGGIRVPANKSKGAISVDSYSNTQGGRKYGSKACAMIGFKLDVANSSKTGKAFGMLYGRPNEKDDLHRQVMLAAIYFGFEVFYEHTSDDYLTYFRGRGYIGYLGSYPLSLIDHKNRDKQERYKGTPITPFSLTKQLDNGVSYFEHYCDKIDFVEILQVAKKFDPYNRTEFDIMVSFLILVTVLFEPTYAPPPPKFPLVKIYPNAPQIQSY